MGLSGPMIARIKTSLNGLGMAGVMRAVFWFAAEDRAWLKWCDGWHEREEPGRAIGGRCGQSLFHRHSGMLIFSQVGRPNKEYRPGPLDQSKCITCCPGI